MRALWLGGDMGNSLWLSVVWCFVLLAVFAPLAVRKYRKAASQLGRQHAAVDRKQRRR